MSHKEVKQLRKQQHMESKQQIQYSMQQLETFIALHTLLTGKKPEKLALIEPYYNWYIQEAQSIADSLGLNLGFRDSNPTFSGVKLEKKINIEITSQMPTPSK